MPTTYRHFRCPDELWKPVAAIAAEVSPDRGVSGLIIDFFQALVAGTREPFPHVKSEADGVDEINPEVWKLIAAAIAPAVTHDVHMAVKRALKKMENPLPRRAVAKTSGARVPEVLIDRRPPAPRKLLKEAGPPRDPSECKHEEFRHRKMRFGTWCSCGAHLVDGTWRLPAKEAAK